MPLQVPGFEAFVKKLICLTAAVMSFQAGAVSANLDGVKIIVRNGDAASFRPPMNVNAPVVDPDNYDVVVIGGGLAGLSSALYLTDAGKKVLLLEKESYLGGLSAGGMEGDGTEFGRGAAYWTDPYEEEEAILNRIGLGEFRKTNPIPEPIDSYYVRGQYFKGIWDEETLAKLPASFSVFKFELQRLIDENKIPNQPIEEAEKYGQSLDLDRINSRQWIESFPKSLEQFVNQQNAPDAVKLKLGKEIFERYNNEMASHQLAGPTGMEAVVELLNLYCRSALGGNTDDVSAVSLANFYESEIFTRYTSDEGNGIAPAKIVAELAKKPTLFKGLTQAPVVKVRSLDGSVEIQYNLKGVSHLVRGQYAVFASQLMLAPRLIENFEKKAPEQAQLIQSLGYTHYMVHSVHVKGQPYRAAYDTWVHANDYTDNDFSDVILGDWMNPKMLGYLGFRDFKADPPIQDGVFSIYHPLPKKLAKLDLSENESKRIALRATKRLADLFSKLPSDLWQGEFKVRYIETNRWPYSIHTTRPGFFTNMVRVMRRPFGRVFFAHSNLGTPAFEEALFRGHCAADNVLKRMDPSFTIEKWSHCPLED